MVKIHNIYAPGLRRGVESFQHNPSKKVFYVEHPTEGWRVFLRAVCFIHEEGYPDRRRFIVTRRTGGNSTEKVWEAPKGQMEGKDAQQHPRWPVMKLLKENIKRECKEEAKIERFVSLEPVEGLILQGREQEYPPNYFFQYQVFQGIVKTSVLQKAVDIFAWYKKHPREFQRLSHDDNEKDEITWYSPRGTRIMGRWSPALTKMYLAEG